MKSTQSDLEIQILFALLRSGIWQKKDSALNEINLSSDSWSAVYEYAKAQGVLSIVYDGISFLEHNQMPPDDLLLNWGINARMQAAKYEKYCEVLQDIENYAETNNLKILFFKGVALSSLYPKPAYREFGDIDLYCVEGKDKFFSYLESVTEKKAVVGDCHTTYRCKNIPIEYHSRFVAINRFNFFFDYLRKRKSEKLDKTLKGIITSKELPWISTETSNFKTLPYTAAFVHLAYHTAVHLSRTIVLRHLCDWTLFLNTYKGKYDESLAAKVLEKTPYKDIAPILSNIAQKYLGLPAESVPEFCRNVKCNKISERVLDNIFSPFTVLPDKPTRKAVFWWKFKRFFFEHWKYKLVYKETSLEIMIRGGVPFLTTRIKRILKPLHI